MYRLNELHNLQEILHYSHFLYCKIKPCTFLQMHGGLACKSTNSVIDIEAYIFPVNRAKE
jgi:hypothetical protein